MASYNPRLLIPPEEEEVYPYRRVWRSLTIEALLLLLAAVILFVLVAIAGVRLPQALYRPLNLVLAVLPLAFWLLFSVLQERFVPEPRTRLIAVAVVSGLAANAVAIPLVESVLQTERWLPLTGAISRIVGYTFTVGVAHEFLKYLVVRYIVWPDNLRTRMDGIAYSLAAAVGFVTVLNLQYVLGGASTPPDSVALRVVNNVALQFAASIVVGYGLAEVRFGQPSPLLLALTLAVASTLHGVVIPVRAGLVNAVLTFEAAFASPIRGMGLSAVLLVVVAISIGFLVENADRQEREAAAARET